MSQNRFAVNKKLDSVNGIRTLMKTLKRLYAAVLLGFRVDPSSRKFFTGPKDFR